MGTKVREKEYLSVVNNTKKGYNLVLSTNCGNSFVNHPEGFFIIIFLILNYLNNLLRNERKFNPTEDLSRCLLLYR